MNSAAIQDRLFRSELTASKRGMILMKRQWLVLLGVVILWFQVAPCLAVPRAEPVASVFTFDSLPEGEPIDHTFVIKNTGDMDLNILNVLPP